MKKTVTASYRKYWIIAGIIVLVGLFWRTTSFFQKQSPDVLELVVRCQDFEETIHAMGVVQAAQYEKLRAPQAPYERQVTWLIDEGTFVKKGDLVAQFDIADIEKRWERETEWVDRIGQRQEEAKATWEVNLYEQTIKRDKEGERNEFAKLKFQRVKQEPPLPREIGTTEKTMQERLVSDANRRLGQEEKKKNVDLSRRQGWLRYRQTKTDEVKAMMPQYEVRAPIDSIIVYPLIPINGLVKKVEPGDYLNRDQPFAQLPDLSSLIVQLGVEEYHVKKITENTEVKFSARSYPSKKFTGRVISVSHMATTDLFHDGRRLFEVIVAVDDVISSGLKVGMVVDSSIVISKHPHVYAFPKDYIIRNEKGAWIEIKTTWGTHMENLSQAIECDDFMLLPAKQNQTDPINLLYRFSKNGNQTPTSAMGK